VREKRITTPDGHAWYVRRRWAKRQLPWKRRANYELSPAERNAVPIVADTDELLGPVVEFFSLDAEFGLLIVLALLALVALGVFALVLLDRLTRPWFVEAESARLFHAPRRIWRIQGWWRSRRAFRAVATVIAEGRIDNERGAILFTEQSTAQ
jgi:hypothetical protein